MRKESKGSKGKEEREGGGKERKSYRAEEVE